MHRSVASRAGGIDLPELSGELVAKGAGRVWELVEILERRSPSMVMSA
jgi:hypothetical protein